MWQFKGDESNTARTIKDAAEGKYINPREGFALLFDHLGERARGIHLLQGKTVAHGLTDEFMRGLGFFPENKGFLDEKQIGSLRPPDSFRQRAYIAQHPELPVHAEILVASSNVSDGSGSGRTIRAELPTGFVIRYGRYAPPTR